MPIHKELIELARMCWRQVRFAQTQPVDRELRRMAIEYQHKAAELDGGRLPDIGQDAEPQV
jgi:hypothetical protein